MEVKGTTRAWIGSEKETCGRYPKACLKEVIDNLDGTKATKCSITFNRPERIIRVYDNGKLWEGLEEFLEEAIMPGLEAKGLHVYHMGLKKAAIGLTKCKDGTGTLRIISKDDNIVEVGWIDFNKKAGRADSHHRTFRGEKTSEYEKYGNGVTVEFLNCEESVFEESFKKELIDTISVSYHRFFKRNGIEEVTVDGVKVITSDPFMLEKYENAKVGCYEEKDFYVKVDTLRCNNFSVRVLGYFNSRTKGETPNLRHGIKVSICGMLTEVSCKDTYNYADTDGGGAKKIAQVIILDDKNFKYFPTCSLKSMGFQNLATDENFKKITLKGSKKTLYNAMKDLYASLRLVNSIEGDKKNPIMFSTSDAFQDVMDHGKDSKTYAMIKNPMPVAGFEERLDDTAAIWEKEFEDCGLRLKIDGFGSLSPDLQVVITELTKSSDNADEFIKRVNNIIKNNNIIKHNAYAEAGKN